MRLNHCLFLLIILQSCQSNLLVDNKPIIDNIDKHDFSKTILEVLIDDSEEIIDTLSIEKIKKNENGNVIFEFRESWNKYGKTTRQSYYRDNEDLFYQFTELGVGNLKMEYQTFVNKDNIIDKAQMVSIESKSSDTIFMKYNYSFNKKGKKETLSITSERDSISSVSLLKYNSNEKTEFKYHIIDNDTLEKSRFIYKNGLITESIHEYIKPYKKVFYKYDDNEGVKFRKTFKKEKDSLIKTEEYIYKNDSSGIPEEIVIKDFENNIVMKRKYITTHNKVLW